jgi:hypothetical protein
MKALIAFAVLFILAWIIWPSGGNPDGEQMFI